MTSEQMYNWWLMENHPRSYEVMEWYENREHDWRKQPKLRDEQLIAIFGDGNTQVLRKYLKEKIEGLRKEIFPIRLHIRDLRQMIGDREFLDWLEEREKTNIENLLKQINRLQYLLDGFKPKKKNAKVNPKHLTETDIMMARETPVENFIEFNRMGFAPCLWHDEKTGSMKWNQAKNRVHCFGCGYDGDVVDVVMKQRGLKNFLEGVRVLINK